VWSDELWREKNGITVGRIRKGDFFVFFFFNDLSEIEFSILLSIAEIIVL